MENDPFPILHSQFPILNFMKHFLFLLLFLLLGCALPGLLQGEVATVTAVPPTATPIVLIATPTPLSDTDLAPIDIEEQLITNLYERVGPSVVHITARVVTMNFFFGPQPSEGTGSGFVFDELGHIVTNYHVVEGAESLEVAFSDSLQVPAQVVGTDPANDLAVIVVTDMPEGLTPLTLASAADLRVGQRAIAIGNPFGLDQTLTTGVISALGRPLQTDNDTYIYNVIQTDAAINPGNSGGPLLNSRGELMGVNTAIRQGAEGIGFAVPVDTVQRVVPSLIEDGVYPHPWLGLLGYSITPDLADTLQLPVTEGVLVAQLYRNSPAVASGIRGAQREVIVGNRRVLVGGDILTAVTLNATTTPIRNWQQLAELIELNTRVGDTLTFSLLRDGQPLELPLTLAAQP